LFKKLTYDIVNKYFSYYFLSLFTKNLISILKNFNFFILFFVFYSNSSFAQPTIKIGNQFWMTENLNANNFSNGEAILQAQSDKEWENAGFNKTPAWCYQTLDTISPADKRPKLYNRFVVNDNRNVCPSGWHIATNKDWDELIQYYKGETIAGKNLKSASWIDSIKYNNLFNAIPVGWRDVGFGDFGTQTNWWSKDTTEDGGNYYYLIFSNATNVVKYNTTWINGFSIRCVKR
jgi:uncharacterized protein (TIGR02145 family)